MLAYRVRHLGTTAKKAVSTSVVVYDKRPTEVEKYYPIKREIGKYKMHDNKVEYVTTKLDDVFNYVRAGSIWPMTFG
mgnify:CR=1 FL=1